MGSVVSVINSAIENAIHELIISILDILFFLLILFLLTIAGWLIAVVIKFVFGALFRNCGRKNLGLVPDVRI